MDGHHFPEGALSRNDIQLLVVSFQTVARSGCTCDVRFVVRDCGCEGRHSIVDTFHSDTCGAVRRQAAPMN